jgi:apolipoprotein N-acyltransferase
LKKFSIESAAAGRYGLAVVAGLLTSLGFAPAQLGGAAWVGPGLILFCGLGCGGGRAFRVGWVAGLAHFLSSLYWLLAMPFAWHGIPLAPALAWVALSAYCAVFFGLWVWFCWKVFPGEISAPELSLPGLVDQFLSTPPWKRVAWAIVCAAGWTALEVARGRVLGGFPWNFLAASQYRLTPLIQIASITGVCGVSFLMAWFSVGLGAAMLALARCPSTQRIWSDAALPLLAVAGVVSFGMTQFAPAPASGREIKVALVQPSIPQTLIFDPKEDAARFQEVIALSEQALEAKPDLLLWPESAVPNLGAECQQGIARLLGRHPLWLIFCADSNEPLPSGANADFNSSFLVDPAGAIRAIYHKRRLVIFGEYIPLVRWLPFLRWLTPIGDGFTPGDRPVPFEMTHPDARCSVLICFEDIFPQEAREHAGPDIDFLINLTNDGWFGNGPEQLQQAAGAVFRAVENGMPLLRCTNNGLTCWVDAQGRLRRIQEAGGNIYGPGFITPTIPLPPPGGHRRTFYNRYGDWFGWSCCGLSVCALMLPRGRRPSSGAVSTDSQDSA